LKFTKEKALYQNNDIITPVKVIDRELIKEDIKGLKKLQKTVKHRRFVPRIHLV